MTDKEKAFMLHIALASFESVRSDELPKTARCTRMDRGIDRILELIDIYRPEGWPDELTKLAGDIVDEFNERIARAFGEENILQKELGDNV